MHKESPGTFPGFLCACLVVSWYNRLKEPVIICGRQMNKYVRLARRLMV